MKLLKEDKGEVVWELKGDMGSKIDDGALLQDIFEQSERPAAVMVIKLAFICT